MTLLIAYATTDGQTRKIARFCADRLAARHSVELLNVADAEGLDPARFQASILAGSLHMHRFQPALTAFAKAHAAALAVRPSLFLAVSLAAAGDEAEDLKGLQDCHAAFMAETGWTPGQVVDVAGAFRFPEYNFFEAWAMRRIAAAKGQDIGPDGTREYTDWTVLADALDHWEAGLVAA